MEIKVNFFREDNGQCRQIYKEVGKERYFGRFETGEWYTLSDAPNGYCEMDCRAAHDITFVVVGKNGRIFFEESNGSNTEPFPFFNKTCRDEWAKIKDKYNATRDGYKRWICSFIDAEKYPEYGKSMSPTVIDDNWSDFYYDVIETVTIHRFMYLGKQCVIHRLRNKHRICGVEWFEYMVGYGGDEGYDYFAGWETAENSTSDSTKEAEQKYDKDTMLALAEYFTASDTNAAQPDETWADGFKVVTSKIDNLRKHFTSEEISAIIVNSGDIRRLLVNAGLMADKTKGAE